MGTLPVVASTNLLGFFSSNLKPRQNMETIATPAQPAEWLIQCVEKSTGFLRSFNVIGSREDAEWHFRDTERSADRHPDAWVPKFILPNANIHGSHADE
jgi:hypothetical protein